MKINDMFLKDIHRNIEGVITATQASDEQVYQELDEYVVTKELQGHFKTFFDAYKKRDSWRYKFNGGLDSRVLRFW